MIAQNDSSFMIELTEEIIDVSVVTAFLSRAEGGAIDVFVGTTRRYTDGKETVHLSYEAASDLAREEIRRIIEDAVRRWPVLRAAVIHRLGTVPVAEASVVIGVATLHRSESFEACRYLIDALKKRVPVWKKEYYADGNAEWVQGSVPE